jgi:PAS domain S-box-containing protein
MRWLAWADALMNEKRSASGARDESEGPGGIVEFRRKKELLKTGALQDAIFNSANFSSIATDEKGVIQIFNVGAERMLGYAASDVVNRITPATISDPQELIARAAALSLELDTPITPGFEALVFKASRGIEDIYELTYIRKDGSRLPAIVSVTALRDEKDAIIGYLLIGTDNTARRQAEEALLKAGALQSAIFNSANFSSIATDAKGVIQIFNVGAERMLGYAAAEVMNKVTPADISDPQELIVRATALSLELGTPITPGFEALVFKASRGIEDIYELTYIRKDGSRFAAIVSVTALRDAQESIIGYLLIGTDNTARKQVEEARALLDQRLRDQQFYTRSLIESNIDALMTTDPQGVISDVNQQMISLTGRTRDELIGAPCRNFFTDPVRADAAIKRVLTENKVSDYELTVRAQNGEKTVVSYNAATFHDRDRNLQGVFAAARDVTERKRFERTLQEKNVELEHASRMKSEFLATMSHELRTPLNAIIGFSEALKDGLMGQMSATQHEYIGDIFTSGQHLLSLINDILDLSKVEAGMMELELEAVDLHSLLSNSLTIVREKAAVQRIQLDLETAEDLGLLQLDMRKTKQIVYNLLSNAVKFSANRGRVTVRAQRVPRGTVCTLAGSWPVHCFPLPDSDYQEFIEISFSDSGIGISKQNMGKLFQPFSQIDSSLARKFEGTGLGLAMVKQLAELHGGTVAVASAEGEGARFAVWLPLRTSTQTTSATPHLAVPRKSEPPSPPIKASAHDERMALVVEDDDHAADLVRLLLEADGFTVLRAASAEDALLLAPQQPLRLITLDIQLPGMNGWDFLLRLRENDILARVPVVIIAGEPEKNVALTRGAACVLQKPVSRAELKACLIDLDLNPGRKRSHTVLVVDDDPKAVEVIAAFLPSPDYAVVRAYGGNEAINLAQRLQPDLILLDLMMPDVSGFDVAEALQSNPDTATIPILVVTAKQITALDLADLNGNPGRVIGIVEKAGFNRAQFVDQVRRMFLPHPESAADAPNPDH